MILSHIVAASKNQSIGLNGTLPWDIPEDLKFFRDKTKGHAIIMGRKTYESIGKALPHRLNVVVTRQKDYKVDENTYVFTSIEDAIEFCKTKINEYGEEVFIIGGGEIYRQSMDIVNIIYLTQIHKDFSGDTFYPQIDFDRFEEVERRDREEPVPFSFLIYRKKMGQLTD